MTRCPTPPSIELATQSKIHQGLDTDPAFVRRRDSSLEQIRLHRYKVTNSPNVDNKLIGNFWATRFVVREIVLVPELSYLSSCARLGDRGASFF